MIESYAILIDLEPGELISLGLAEYRGKESCTRVSAYQEAVQVL